jgi:hypothetical protein
MEDLKNLLKNKKFEKKDGKILIKTQRLALEIIEYVGKSEYSKRWFRICKKSPEFVEDKFRQFKEKGIKDGAYLFRMIYPRKK